MGVATASAGDFMFTAAVELLRAGAWATLGLALALFVAPEGSRRMSRTLLNSVPALRSLGCPRHTVERWFYRYHSTTGSLLILSALYVLYRAAFQFPTDAIAGALSETHASLWSSLLESLRFLLIVINALMLLIGFTVVVRPSLLKTPEAWANRGLSPGLPIPFREKSPGVRSPRALGGTLLVVSFALLIVIDI